MRLASAEVSYKKYKMKYVHNFIPQNVECIKLNIYTLIYKVIGVKKQKTN